MRKTLSFGESLAAMLRFAGRSISFKTESLGRREWTKLEAVFAGAEEDPCEPGSWMLGFEPGGGLVVFDEGSFVRGELHDQPAFGVLELTLHLAGRRLVLADDDLLLDFGRSHPEVVDAMLQAVASADARAGDE